MTYENIQVETRGPVALITLNRPKAFNALSNDLMDELSQALDAVEVDESIRAIVLTGGEKVFAAGADIKGMKDYSYMDAYKGNFITRNWERASRCRKPVIAAVAGYALGGGCELAMQCDMIVAAEDARFGQPEIKLGIIPGAGGTQRLTRAVGKARAMELILTGRMVEAREAEALGLVNRVVPGAEVLPVALGLAATVAGMPPLAVQAAKAAIEAAHELPLRDGLAFERRSFYLLFATEDRSEGMAAFLEKRAPSWKGS